MVVEGSRVQNSPTGSVNALLVRKGATDHQKREDVPDPMVENDKGGQCNINVNETAKM